MWSDSNPAVIELKKRLEQGDLGRAFLAHARRLGPFPERVRDMGVAGRHKKQRSWIENEMCQLEC